MSNDNGGPAFPIPHPDMTINGQSAKETQGMTLRQYAAIELCVPNSGTDWLDEMITQSLKDKFAATAIRSVEKRLGMFDPEIIALRCYELADVMLAEREKGGAA